MAKAMNTDAEDWENLYYGAGGAEHVLLLGFKQDSLKKFTGKTLAEVAALRATSPEETAMDLIIQDSTRVGVAYFMMTEDNVKKQVALSWVSFGSDEGSYTNEGVFLKFNAHPRAYGNFARVLAQLWKTEHQVNSGFRYLFLDEPLTFLDIRHQIEFMKKVQEFSSLADVVVIGVVHDLNLAARFADQIALIDQGRIVANGPPDEVLTTDRIKQVFDVQPAFVRSADGQSYIVFD